MRTMFNLYKTTGATSLSWSFSSFDAFTRKWAQQIYAFQHPEVRKLLEFFFLQKLGVEQLK